MTRLANFPAPRWQWQAKADPWVKLHFDTTELHHHWHPQHEAQNGPKHHGVGSGTWGSICKPHFLNFVDLFGFSRLDCSAELERKNLYFNGCWVSPSTTVVACHGQHGVESQSQTRGAGESKRSTWRQLITVWVTVNFFFHSLNLEHFRYL